MNTRIIDYDVVLQRLTGKGLVCNYHNSGAFAFGREVETKIIGWIGPEDLTIREAMLPQIMRVPAPYPANLARLAARVHVELLGDAVWAMPMSHWAYELEFGSGSWMPNLLAGVGVDAADLRTRNNAAAVEFAAGEAGFDIFVRGLLERLVGQQRFHAGVPGSAGVVHGASSPAVVVDDARRRSGGGLAGAG